MDNDGLLDLVIGEQTATLNYYHNNGTAASASFTAIPTIDTLGHILLAQVGSFSGYSVPYVFTFSGRHQMLTANMHGDIYYYENIDNNLSGTFNRIDTVASGEFGIRSSGFNLYVSGGDINNDGLMDMLVGFYSGGVQIYYGSNLPISVPEIESGELLRCYPNPASSQLAVGGGRFAINSISIYDVLGKLLLAEKQEAGSSNQKMLVDVSKIPSGMYIVVASDGKSSQRARVIIQH
jgi:hypothetical protein